MEPLDTIGGDNDYGDGTVPLTGAVGHDLPMNTNTVRRIAEQHGSLQANPYALDELEEAITTIPVRRRAAGSVAVGVAVPDLILAGEALPVEVDLESDDRHGVLVTVVDEHDKTIASRTPRIRSGHLATSFDGLPPGAYDVRVSGPTAGSPISPVTVPILVWDAAYEM